MAMFFKKKNDRPLNFSYIEERKQDTNYSSWIIGIILLLTAAIALYFLLK